MPHNYFWNKFIIDYWIKWLIIIKSHKYWFITDLEAIQTKSIKQQYMYIYIYLFALGVVVEWSKLLTAVPWPLLVWSTLALGTYQLRFVSWVFHVIFSFVHFMLLYTLGGLHSFRKPLPYIMYLFNLLIANHILIKILNKS